MDVDNSETFMPSALPRRKKRKVEEELSSNPNTMRARARRAKLETNSIAIKIEKAKNADQAAITFQKSKLRKTLAFINASKEDQRKMLDASKAQTMHKR